MAIYFSTGAFQDKNLAEIIAFSLEHKLENIELSSGGSYSPNLLDPVYQTKDKINYLVHNYFPPPAESFVLNLASNDADILNRSHNLCKTAIDLTVSLEAPFYSVHSGFAFNLTPKLLGDPVAQSKISEHNYLPYEQAYKIFVNSIISLNNYARSKGIQLLIENNVVSPLYLAKHGRNALLMSTATEIKQLMQDVNDDNLGFLLDVGHLKVTATALNFKAEDFINQTKPYIKALHLSDNDGETDQNLPFGIEAWFYPFLSQFTHVPWVIEAYRLTWQQMKEQYNILNILLNN